jgi:hypothetical protein
MEFRGDCTQAENDDEKIKRVQRPSEKRREKRVALNRSEPPKVPEKLDRILARKNSRRILSHGPRARGLTGSRPFLGAIAHTQRGAREEAAIPLPSAFSAALARRTRTGQPASFTTFSVTDPNAMLRQPVMPCVDMMIIST